MARPKHNENSPGALERIEAAFWEMLGEMPYESITVSALARRAKVNHNTIYYHYEGIDQMAIKLFDKNIPANIGTIFHSMITHAADDLLGSYPQEQMTVQRSRVMLFLRSESPFLMQHMKSRIIASWCSAMEIDPKDLTKEQQIDLEFIFSGMAAAMRLSYEMGVPFHVSSLRQRPLGKAILATLANLKPVD